METASPIKDVLYNPDLLGIICWFLCRNLSISDMLNDKLHTKSLCVLALTCHGTCDTVLDCLWHDISGMEPLLSIFPRAISPSDHLPWVRRDSASLRTILTVRRYPPLPYQTKHGRGSTYTRAVFALSILKHTRAHCTPQPSSYDLPRNRNPFFPNCKNSPLMWVLPPIPPCYYFVQSSVG